jgi:hypothetical protein
VSPYSVWFFTAGNIGVPNWIMNTSMTEFAKFKGSLRTTTINGPITGLELNLGILDDFVKGRAEANSTLARRGWIRSYGMVWPRSASHAARRPRSLPGVPSVA